MNLCHIRLTGYALLCKECFKVNMQARMHMYAHINMAVICRVYLQICTCRFFKLKTPLLDEYSLAPSYTLFLCLTYCIFTLASISRKKLSTHTSVLCSVLISAKKVYTSWRGCTEGPQIQSKDWEVCHVRKG